jgi:hypothetical protein
MTSSGFQPATFRLVRQLLNQLHLNVLILILLDYNIIFTRYIIFIIIIYYVVVKARCYKPEGRGFAKRCNDFFKFT